MRKDQAKPLATTPIINGELDRTLERLGRTMPTAPAPEVLATGMVYFANKLARHMGADYATQALLALTETMHAEALKDAKATRN